MVVRLPVSQSCHTNIYIYKQRYAHAFTHTNTQAYTYTCTYTYTQLDARLHHPGHTYIAPYKLADVDANGTLRFAWWPQNDNFKGTPLPLTDTHADPFLPWAVNVSEGVIIEATTTLPALTPRGKELEQLPGFVLEILGGQVRGG